MGDPVQSAMNCIRFLSWLPVGLVLPLVLIVSPAEGEAAIFPAQTSDATLLVEVTSEGSPVEGAEVRAEPSGLRTTTDSQGRARLRLPVGDLTSASPTSASAPRPFRWASGDSLPWMG